MRSNFFQVLQYFSRFLPPPLFFQVFQVWPCFFQVFQGTLTNASALFTNKPEQENLRQTELAARQAEITVLTATVDF